MATDWPGHFCPSCGAPQTAFPRYPWYLCSDCRGRTHDRDGNRIEFFNAHLFGGLGFRFAGEAQFWEIRSAICLVTRRPVLVSEARFGGVVVEPLPDRVFDFEQVTDMRRPGWRDRLPEPSGSRP
ncbi:ADP-ribosylglycohydrolase [Pelagovum pacificum]|uniref:ADP-ribosylglycohydrolase n=1 Tax=Pelagovum pacificum TaxID=2588711 RepID=A0A5C5GKA1_9RHOB|nr:ADP-ribosylglycohydrolase [Pelagovum pacificum]QQA42618.1 hypothetical protein I8N54_17850 [Pelagovum pacificum]TNY34231.1 ADP-ribosylglycohydrolase [Pelagovum pacificum]